MHHQTNWRHKIALSENCGSKNRTCSRFRHAFYFTCINMDVLDSTENTKKTSMRIHDLLVFA
jgi:hypothetical protein